MAGRIMGWKLPPDERARLLARFPPKYAEVVADHVTLKVAGGGDASQPPAARAGRVVGIADDSRHGPGGVQALVVEIDGTIDRPDGSTYHMTWSLGPGRKARESNDVISALGWTAVDPIPVKLEPGLVG
jgi:hypothetical protein